MDQSSKTLPTRKVLEVTEGDFTTEALGKRRIGVSANGEQRTVNGVFLTDYD